MKKEERERFLSLSFTEDELEIRDELYKNRELAKYKIIITTEHYDKQRLFDERKPPYDTYLDYFSDNPEEGNYLDTIYFYNPDQFHAIISLYEGQFYQLFDLKTEDLIGSGCLDPDSPIEEIRENESNDECCGNCNLCFFRGGLLYEERKGRGEVDKCFKEGHEKVLDGFEKERVIHFEFDAVIEDTKENEKKIRNALEKCGLEILGFERTASCTLKELGMD